jgi:hypothetical protein
MRSHAERLGLAIVSLLWMSLLIFAAVQGMSQ